MVMVSDAHLVFNARPAPRPSVRILAGLSLARPLNCAMSALAVLLGAWSVTRQVPATTLLGGMACAALITAGGNTLNDFFDAEHDRLNHPRRAIPSGRISRSTALAIAWSELGMGAAAGFVVGALSGLIAVVAILLLMGYEAAGLKSAGLPGNLTISLLTALLFLLGGTIAGDPVRPASLALLAFVASLGREIIKDIEDIRGDTSRRTWPMRVGVRRAKIAAALMLGSAVLLSPLPYLLGVLSVWYLRIVAAADCAFLVTIFLLIRPARVVSRTAKLAMVSVLAAMLAGTLG